MEKRRAPVTLIVVDASIVGTIVLNETDSVVAEEIEARLVDAELAVSAHSSLEIASILVKAARRQRTVLTDRQARLNRAERILRSATAHPATSSQAIFDLAMATGLAAYDAVYLELALRLDATLATNDDALLAAARARGVPVLTTRP